MKCSKLISNDNNFCLIDGSFFNFLEPIIIYRPTLFLNRWPGCKFCVVVLLLLLPPPTISVGVGRIFQSVCLTVCLSVCPQHDDWSQSFQTWCREWAWGILEVVLFWGSKVKVTRQINAHTVNAQYLLNGKVYVYEVQTWYTDRARRLISATSAVTSKVKGQGCKVTWHIWQVLADKSRTKRSRNTKISGKVTHPTGNNA